MIAFDADCLEGTLGRMSTFCPHLCRNCCFNDFVQFSCRFDWFLFPGCHDVLGNVLCELVLTIIADHPKQFHLAVFINNLSCRKAAPLIHPHIERCIIPVGKSPLFIIKLIRGNSQIQQHSVNSVNL